MWIYYIIATAQQGNFNSAFLGFQGLLLTYLEGFIKAGYNYQLKYNFYTVAIYLQIM